MGALFTRYRSGVLAWLFQAVKHSSYKPCKTIWYYKLIFLSTDLTNKIRHFQPWTELRIISWHYPEALEHNSLRTQCLNPLLQTFSGDLRHPPPTWTLRRLLCCSEFVWQEKLQLRSSCVKGKLRRKSGPNSVDFLRSSCVKTTIVF